MVMLKAVGAGLMAGLIMVILGMIAIGEGLEQAGACLAR